MIGTVAGDREWLEPDGRGGFASGTVAGPRTRRYHALLLVATTPPTGRVVLVNGFDAWIETAAGRFPLTSQRYRPDVVHPAGVEPEAFDPEPWPRWVFGLEDGTRVEQEAFVHRQSGATCLSWRLLAGGPATLLVRPFLSGRDYHALHKENGVFRFDAAVDGDTVTWRPYDGLPPVVARHDGTYVHEPDWYRSFLYEAERDRGLDDTEDLAAPGHFRWALGTKCASLVLAPGAPPSLRAARASERRRRSAFATPLDRAADAYVVARGGGRTIVAGYPWFTDWGRDTFLAMRGLCLATGRVDEARSILREWAGAVSEGMLPNRFPDRGEAPEYNSVDASLWYVVAVHETLAASDEEDARLREAVDAILDGYSSGTRHGIAADGDGLLRAGETGQQLTWMDARVDGRVITPRIGKPVEVNALWVNALRIGGARWKALHDRADAAFRERFWNDDRGCLFDVVDPADAAFRPNQILAVGGLPFPVIEGERARRVVDAVEERLWTPLGLRSLAPGEPGYAPRYRGGVPERDAAYHQGTVWPWLLGPFVEAWVRVRGGGARVKGQARRRFLDPLMRHLDLAGVGHLPEIADADAPHLPRGCPFQAWSLGEALRLDRLVL